MFERSFCAVKKLALLLLFLPAIAFASDTRKGIPHGCWRADYGAAGTVHLDFTIRPDGRIEDIKVVQSSGNVLLDRAARQCAARWTYFPAMQAGAPVAVPWAADIVYSLDGSSVIVEHMP
jgi:TonB family protein